VWVKDAAVDAYIKTCQGTKLGDPIDPVYRERIDAATLVSDAILAYEKRDFRRALDLYGRAVRSAAGDQLRVHSGLYLANWKLGKRADAEKAFGHIVDNGIANNKLAVKLLFQPGKTDFWADKQVSGPYPIWLRQIASKLAKTDRCLNVIGHTSRSGPEPVNERLSLARAQNIKWRLESATPDLVTGSRPPAWASAKTWLAPAATTSAICRTGAWSSRSARAARSSACVSFGINGFSLKSPFSLGRRRKSASCRLTRVYCIEPNSNAVLGKKSLTVQRAVTAIRRCAWRRTSISAVG
jgi:outer membrane protein OmpA-like peptidoglycan-associated protein